ncbi:hypothetical protein DMENIID0001_110020 [Sergentomyia squamirostris]
MADSVVCLDDETASKSQTCALSGSGKIGKISGGSDLQAKVVEREHFLAPGTIGLGSVTATVGQTAMRGTLAPPLGPGVIRRSSDKGAPKRPPSAVEAVTVAGPSTATDPGLDPESDECRKKRCTDRYDSSESSDSLRGMFSDRRNALQRTRRVTITISLLYLLSRCVDRS